MAGGGCTRCGYNRSIRALAFHHTQDNKTRHNDRSTIFSANALRRMKWPPGEDFMREFATVECICANCHAEAEEVRAHGSNAWDSLDIDAAIYEGLATRYSRVQSRAACATADLALSA